MGGNSKSIYYICESLRVQSLWVKFLYAKKLWVKAFGWKVYGWTALGEKYMGEKSVGEKSVGEKPVGEKSLGERSVQEESLGEESLGEKYVGGKYMGEKSVARSVWLNRLWVKSIWVRSMGERLRVKSLWVKSIWVKSLWVIFFGENRGRWDAGFRFPLLRWSIDWSSMYMYVLRQCWDQVLGLKAGLPSSLFWHLFFVHTDSYPSLVKKWSRCDHYCSHMLSVKWHDVARCFLNGQCSAVALQCFRLQLHAEALLQMRLDGTFDERQLCVLLSLVDAIHRSQPTHWSNLKHTHTQWHWINMHRLIHTVHSTSTRALSNRRHGVVTR